MDDARKSAGYYLIPVIAVVLIVISAFPSLLQPGARTPSARLIGEAIDKNDLRTLDSLLNNGGDANVDVAPQLPALVAATLENRDEVVRMLLDRGANINAVTSNGWTALHEAAYGGNAGILSLLISRGAQLNMLNVHGDTALILASRSHHTECVEQLLNAGANATMTNRAGETALGAALRNGQLPNAGLLLAAMAGRLQGEALERITSWNPFAPASFPLAFTPEGSPAAGSRVPVLRTPARARLSLRRPHSPPDA